MSSRVVRRWILASAVLTILAVPVVARAQEATVSGTVSDSTGGVLPGVTIKAVNEIDVSDGVRQQIYEGNARRLLRLKVKI